MNRILKYKLFENPNAVAIEKNGKLVDFDWQETKTKCFSYYFDNFFMGNGNDTHYDLWCKYENMFFDPKYKNDKRISQYNEDGRGELAGRLFLTYKIVTFWYFPENNDELKKVADDIKKFSGIDIWNDEWKVEVLKPGIIAKNDWGSWEPSKDMDTEYVPVTQYQLSAKRSEEELKIPHLLNWKEKQALKAKGWGKGFGSDLTAWDGKNPLWWRQLKYQESMKTKFSEFINEVKKQIDFKIYCDMDGVLSDFDEDLRHKFLDKFNKQHGTDFQNGFEFEEAYSSKEFWSEVKKLGLEFWSEMSWKTDGRKLWDYIKQYEGTEILSKPSRDKLSSIGKKIWCKRELGENVKLNLSYKKEEYANPNSILIDDFGKNITPWIKAGGIGILHKNTEDTIKQLKNIIGE